MWLLQVTYMATVHGWSVDDLVASVKDNHGASQVPLQGMLFHQCTYFQARDFGITHWRMVSMELTLLWLAGQSLYPLHTANSTCHFTCQWSLNLHRYWKYTWRRYMYSCLLPACAFITHHTASGCGYFSPHEAGLEKGCGELCCRSHWKVCEWHRTFAWIFKEPTV